VAPYAAYLVAGHHACVVEEVLGSGGLGKGPVLGKVGVCMQALISAAAREGMEC